MKFNFSGSNIDGDVELVFMVAARELEITINLTVEAAEELAQFLRHILDNPISSEPEESSPVVQ